MRAVGYSRVSTIRQVNEGLSVDDQISHIEAYCDGNSLDFVRHYVDQGVSGTDEDRPELQRLIADATVKPREFERIIVHSASRLFRDSAVMELTIRRLRKVGVEVVFITQPTTNDATGDLTRQVLGLIDEFTSKETAKHVARSMLANAKLGFWNGAPAPYGYRTFVAEFKGKKQKKKLEIDPVEARIVEQIFELAEIGTGRSGPMGVKSIVNWLHDEGYKTRRGSFWHVQTVYLILTSSTYKGVFVYNATNSKTKEPRPLHEQLQVECPAIIKPEKWDRVQALLRAKNPKISSPKTISGPILLTGLIRCEACGSAMTMRTGKSGRYRYYTCSGAQARGVAVCVGVSIPMDKLDLAITNSLADKVCQPERLHQLFTEVSLLERKASTGIERELLRVEGELAEAKQRLHRLLASIENGLLDANDPDLGVRLKAVKLDRNIAIEAKSRIEGRMKKVADVSPAKLVAFGSFMREAIRYGDVPFRKAYLRMLVDWIDVEKGSARIRVKKSTLRKRVDDMDCETGKVPIRIQDWRTQHDSNVRPLPSEGNTLSS